MKIIYVHHGNRKRTPDNKLCDKLSSIGKKDANLFAKLLTKIPTKNSIKAIYSAPSNRCQLTANIINKHIKVPVILDSRLDEFGMVKDETYSEMLNRTACVIDEITNKFEDTDSVICVSSGINVSAFICRSFNLAINEDIPKIGIPSLSPLIFEIKKGKTKKCKLKPKDWFLENGN